MTTTTVVSSKVKPPHVAGKRPQRPPPSSMTEVILHVGPEDLRLREQRKPGLCFACGGQVWLELSADGKFDGLRCAHCGRTRSRPRREGAA